MTKQKRDRKGETPGKRGATALTEAQLDEVSAGESKMQRQNNLKQLAIALH